MKRFLSLLMAGSMVVSMMPVTAFAKGDIVATAKVLEMLETTKDAVENNNRIINEVLGTVPELRIKIEEADYRHANGSAVPEEREITVSLDNAKFMENQDFEDMVYVRDDDYSWVIEGGVSRKERLEVSVAQKDIKEDKVTFTFNGNFEEDDIIYIDLHSVMDKTSEGRMASVSVKSDFLTTDKLTYAAIVGKELRVNVDKLATIAVEEFAEIHSGGLEIETAVGYLPRELTLKVNKGFEFANSCDGLKGEGYSITKKNDTELTVAVEETTKEIKAIHSIINEAGKEVTRGETYWK